MTLRGVVDNDILLKGSCYGLLAPMAKVVPLNYDEVGYLGAAPYVVSNRLAKAKLSRPAAVCVRYLNNVFARMILLEPTQAEISLAADIEIAAQQLNFPLDVGESQLCSIVVTRNLEWLITGDKRAIKSLQKILLETNLIASIHNKAICLEQLMFLLICFRNTRARAAVCAENSVDRTFALALSCNTPQTAISSCLQGLRSYIENLRIDAPLVLASI